MKLNGRTIRLEGEETLAALLRREQYDSRTIAVELNGVIVPKAEYEISRLTDDDVLEIVRFVGGG